MIDREDLWQALHAWLQPSHKRGSNLPMEAVRVRPAQRPALPSRWQGPDPWAAAQQELDRKLAEFEALEKRMAQAARRDGIDEDGPMVPTLQALRLCMDSLRDMTRVVAQIPTHYVGQILDALSASRTVTQAETDRFRAEIEHTETNIIHRVSNSIAASADKAFAHRVRVVDRNTTLLATAALVLVTLGLLYGGYQWGHSDALAGIHETEADLQAAFRDSPASAAQWVNLMRWNNLQHALVQCSGPRGTSHVQEGRLVCDVPLWVQPPLEQTATRQFPSIELTPAPVAPPPAPPQPPPTRTDRPFNPLGILPVPPKGPVHFGPDNSP